MTTKISTERVRDLFSLATAWRSEDPRGGTDLSGLRASNRAEFDMWLAEHDRTVAADARNDAMVDAVAWARSCSGESADMAADYIQEMATQ
ncbi:hypothetical protein E3T43_07390 [Cryobacterium sp. Hh7]|uniref:hypothetical protein n=1 Tax=Cryobacterium sp. Hh7 TaxID=1259159 RepID=UPI00106CA606|nr:hypothetical protein [Cryobacterium sp. Hh7]TFD58061.1 hypothetical protein E3T43_07390 [Cryobacterium sp. Hh7]